MQSSVRTSQETHYVSATKPNLLMLSREIIAVYCENHTEHISALLRRNPEFPNTRANGIYNYHCALTGSNCTRLTVTTAGSISLISRAVAPSNLQWP
jgi:hypothetical protein